MKEWRPTERQEFALRRREKEILFGGARGGGKTDAGQVWLLCHKDNPQYRALVIRRNADDLRDWIDRARTMYSGTGADFVGNPVEIKFPSGAIIRTGHLKDSNAYTKYQGHEYQRMVVEEVTHIAQEGDYEKLLGSCRSTVPDIKPRIFLTTNPDGPGHAWVKERFCCNEPDDKPRTYKDEATGRELARIFISSKIEDNPHLMEADPDYLVFLNSIQDPVLQRQWREGSWEDIPIEGAYYRKQIQEAREEDRITYIPWEESLSVYTFWDLGIGDSTAIWFVQRVGKEIRLIDYYENTGEGFPFYAKVLQDKGYIYARHYAPHDIQVRELGSGKSRLETAQSLGIRFDIVPNISVEDGINAARTIFSKCWFDEDKCREGIRALSNYRKEFDEKNNCWKNKPLHDWSSHASDAFRYFAVGFRDKPSNVYKSSPQQKVCPITNYPL